MGESRNLFNIPAYIKVGDKRFKVIKWGVAGAIIESSPIIESEETVTADFIFPYDACNELIIPKVKLKCSSENGTLFCKFEDLSKDQEKLFKFLIREYLWRRIISIPSEFMNYTQDTEVRKELLSFQRNLTLKRRLKKLLYLMILIASAGIMSLGAKIFFYTENIGLTLKYSEANRKKNRTEETEIPVKEKEIKPKTELKIPQEPPQPKVEVNTEKDLKKETGEGNSTQVTVKQNPTPSQKTTNKAEEDKRPLEGNSEKIQVSETVKQEGEELSENGKYYCVQVATDTSAERLIKLADKLKEFPYVRVEKIGKFYTLRVGFDRTYSQDKKLARKIRRKIHKKVFPRVCAYKPERWVYPQVEVK